MLVDKGILTMVYTAWFIETTEQLNIVFSADPHYCAFGYYAPMVLQRTTNPRDINKNKKNNNN